MKVLFWMFIGFDRQTTSGHLLSAVIQSLCESGHSVHILQKDTNGDLPYIPKELSNYPVTTECIPFRAADKSNFIERYLKELIYINACKKHIAREYDAVFIQSTTVAGFAVKAVRNRLPKAIVTLNVQDVFPYNLMYTGKLKKSSLVFKSLAAIQRCGYRFSDHIITISEDMKDLLIEDGSPADKIKVIYNWSYQDEPYEDLDITPISYLLNPGYFNVVYAGNIGVMQNVDVIIEVAELMRRDQRVWFHIIGDGVYKEKLIAKAKELGINNISFWPMQPSRLAPLIYSAADVNIIPLAENIYRTALPSKTATCMACGKPIIFAIGKESLFGKRVEEEAGCALVESDDAEEIAKKIRCMQKTEVKEETKQFFSDNMSITLNSKRYVDFIVLK